MIQQAIIILLFSGAVFFVVRMIYKSFQTKTGCSTGCAKCGAVDFDKIEKKIRSAE
jgi:hypothetical protein